MAESLPLADRSVDLAVCFNALDHMLDPEAALDEIARVLRPGGTALLMIHTFPSWLRPAFPLDRMHPHHFTAETFVSLAGSRLRIDRCRTVRRRFDTSGGKWWMPSMWKYFAAGLFVSITYLRATALPAILPAC
jgi:ubiquinone/menaquinone biosynthesis C-methylase UbiE